MRGSRLALALALRRETAVTALVKPEQIYAVERAVLPTLPSIEIIGVSSERVDGGPLVRHEMSVECTVRHPAEDGADELLDDVVRAVRQRLGAAEQTEAPIALASGETALVSLSATRWSISASAGSTVIRGAAISLSVEVAE